MYLRPSQIPLRRLHQCWAWLSGVSLGRIGGEIRQGIREGIKVVMVYPAPHVGNIPLENFAW